ncbi:MAG TPA: universal stress protein [Gaiellaceae bacterium]|nr:universal stress protein [Gaiellaceae bacterium]
MARKLPGLQRVLDVPSLAAVAYGEISCSIFIALGIVALFALGFTPWVLLVVGALFLLVALSYAEGTAAIPETGGAATFVRRAFNDPLGFLAGWVLFLDYLIVIALAALFVPHYAGHAIGWDAPTDGPADVVIGIGVIAAVALVRLIRRPGMYSVAIVIAGASLAALLALVVLGLPLLFSLENLGKGLDLGTAPTWYAISFSLPLAMLAFTGLETVANLAAETREPGRTLPRSLFTGIGAAVVVSVLVAIVAISAFPAHPDPEGPGGYASDLGTTWLRAPVVGIATAFDGHLPDLVVDLLRMFVGLAGVLILVATVTTSFSGAGRLAYSLGRHEMLPRAFARLSRRTLIAPVSILSVAVISVGLLLLTRAVDEPIRFLASLYSFGILIAFTAAQLAVIRLRFVEPELPRPFRVPGNVAIRGTDVPVAALVGAPLTFAIWVIAFVTHDAARVAGPLWLAVGAVVYVSSRLAGQEKVLGRVTPAVGDLVPEIEGAYRRILVPMKIGPIGEEVLATAIKLAEEQHGTIIALHVIRVPLDQPLDAELIEADEQAEASLAEARLLATEHGIEIQTEVARARAIGEAIVEAARRHDADLIVMGSAPRWRRQSRFFSPTVDYVLRNAPCEVMVIAYPQGVLEEEAVPV